MIQDKTVQYEGAQKVSLEPRKVKPLPEYKAEQVELSKNIRNFDKIKRNVGNPFDYNSVSLKKDNEVIKQASELIVDPLYNQAGKILGVDMIHDWNRYYDKVYEIVKIAKENGIKEENIGPWIYKQANSAPNITGNKINDTFTFLKMSKPKKENTKVIVKKVVKYIRPKNTIDNFVNNLMSLKT